MALVSYESSDEDGEEQHVEERREEKAVDRRSSAGNGPKVTSREPAPSPAPVAPPIQEDQSAIIGPTIGPTAQPSTDPTTAFPPLEEAPPDSSSIPSQAQAPPGSPYSSTRALLRDLTLPTVPNLDIPASPPGSPSPGLATTNKKLEQFLDLKKKGVHFNSKIAQSSALKNPSLMDKLMAFAELEQPAAQYATTLSREASGGWDPTLLPRWAYKEELRKTQTEVASGKSRKTGGAVDFVKAGGEGSGAAGATGSREGTPGAGPATGKRKTRFDT